MSVPHPASGVRLLLKLLALSAVLLAPAPGALTVANLYCTFLISPTTAAQAGLRRSDELNNLYGERFDNLAKLIANSGAEFVGLETIGAKREVEDLAVRLSGISGRTWKGIFIPGAGRPVGRNLAAVYQPRRGLQITGAGAILDLSDVPNHLVFTLTVDEKAYSICLVDLADRSGPNAAAYPTQLQTLQSWATQQIGTAVIMGAFLDERRKLPPLFSINERLGWPATEIGNRGRDYIFSSRDPALGKITAPPFGESPPDSLRAVWSDHFLIKALIP